MMQSNINKGLILLFTATSFWAGNYICGRYLGPTLPATLLNTIRWFLSAIILWGLVKFRQQQLPLFSKWKEFSVLGFLGIFAFSTLNYEGLKLISASRAGMISAIIPILILICTPLILKEKVKPLAWIGSAVSIVGIIILFQGKASNSAGDTSVTGDIMILLSCVAWSLYTVQGKKYGESTGPLTLTAGAAVYGSIFSAISCIGNVNVDTIHMNSTAWVCILYVSTFASVAAYFAWNVGVKLIGASRAAPFINLLPVWTVILGIVLLGEHVSFMSFVGGLIALMGAVLASIK
ncbi:DMT family transporter [Paenibacillus sp. FSL L8-0502]|uniref:DMT family transporter n=2 Tax=unclassified Paenibacillus TaxID=185978 RepID=UPI0031589356